MNLRLQFALRRFAGLLSLAAALVALPAHADTITLDAIQDTWITPRPSTTNYNADFISVKTGSSSTNNARRYGVLEFDLSTVPGPITGATLKLYMNDGTGGTANVGTTTQVALFFPAEAHIDETTLTYAIYTSRADLGPADMPFESLGTYAFTGPLSPVNSYFASDAASANDVAKLEMQRNTPAKLLGILLNANSTTAGTHHDWGDKEHGFPAQLVLEYTPVPEPASIWLASLALVGLAWGVRRALA